jgi:hypothetical protein
MAVAVLRTVVRAGHEDIVARDYDGEVLRSARQRGGSDDLCDSMHFVRAVN